MVRTALDPRYRVERELGSGGMATVFLAHDLRHDRQVAIKVIRPDLAPILGPDRFLREIAIAARLQHPNIVPLFDSGDADGLLYYVMPFVDGESLRDRLARERQLSIDQALVIGRQVTAALQYAHAHGVIHRDIKPANILLSGDIASPGGLGTRSAISLTLDCESDERRFAHHYQWYRRCSILTWDPVGTGSSYSEAAPSGTKFFLRLDITSVGRTATTTRLIGSPLAPCA